MNKVDTETISFYIITNLRISSYIRNLRNCCYLVLYCLTTDIKMKHIYFHISSRKTLVPFALYDLGFIVFFSHSCSFFLSFILCLVAFFLSLRFSKTLCILHSLLQGTQKLKYSNVTLSIVLQKRSLLISGNKIKTIWGV